MQKRDGKVFSDAMWTVSDDGATSTYVSTETRPDGSSSHDETRLKRTAGGTSGSVGTWESNGNKDRLADYAPDRELGRGRLFNE